MQPPCLLARKRVRYTAVMTLANIVTALAHIGIRVHDYARYPDRNVIELTID